MNSNIPKIIHYVLFGDKKKSRLIKNCISTWHKNLPDFEIKEWNETNFDLQNHPFAREAYEAGKFAFVSDYVRVYTIYNQGGIYFDTDVEVMKNFSDVLTGTKGVFAFEMPNTVLTGFFAAEKGNLLLRQILDYYDSITFYDEKGKMRITPNPVIFADAAKNFGLVFDGTYQEFGDGMKIYPNEVFGGYNVYDMTYTITDSTILVHHCTGTWKTFLENIQVYLKKRILKIIGIDAYRSIRRIKHIIFNIK